MANAQNTVPTQEAEAQKDPAASTNMSRQRNEGSVFTPKHDMAKESAAKIGTAEVQATPKLPSDTGFTWGSYFQSLGILFLLLAALWCVVWLLRKYGRFNFIPRPGAFPHDGLRLEAQLPLGPRKGLSVVRFLDKRLLLGVTEHQITLLQTIEDNNEKDSMDFHTHLEHAAWFKAEDAPAPNATNEPASNNTTEHAPKNNT